MRFMNPAMRYRALLNVDAGAGAGAGGAAGAGGGVGTGGAAGAGGASGGAAAFDWSTAGLDTDTSAFVTGKGWKAPADVIGSYRNLEKLTGSMDKIVQLPGDDKPETMSAFYAKLGRPEAPDGYTLPVPEGVDPAFSKTAATWFHEAGLTPKQATALAEKWNSHMGGLNTASVQAQQAKFVAEEATLKGEWQSNYDANVGKAKQAAAALGLDAATIDQLEKGMGFATVMKFMHSVGTKLGTDDTFVSDAGGRGASLGGHTPDQASARIKELYADKAWGKRYASGDKDARQEMERLQRIANPGTISI